MSFKNTYQLLSALCITFLLCASSVSAQLINNAEFNEHDVEFWTGIGLEHEVNDIIGISFDYQVRYNNNVNRFKNTFGEAAVGFKIVKNLKADVGLRYIYNARKRYVFRPIANIVYKPLNTKKLDVVLRLRLQKDFDHFLREEFIQDYYSRLRVQFNVNTKSIDPYFGAEIFHLFKYNGNRFDQLRLSAGVRIPVTKRHEVKLGYVYREEFNIREPLQSHILQAKFNFEIKKKKKKKKKSPIDLAKPIEQPVIQQNTTKEVKVEPTNANERPSSINPSAVSTTNPSRIKSSPVTNKKTTDPNINVNEDLNPSNNSRPIRVESATPVLENTNANPTAPVYTYPDNNTSGNVNDNAQPSRIIYSNEAPEPVSNTTTYPQSQPQIIPTEEQIREVLPAQNQPAQNADQNVIIIFNPDTGEIRAIPNATLTPPDNQ